MSDSRVEKKLELVREIRASAAQNRDTVSRREGILYSDNAPSRKSGLFYRLLLSAALLAVFVIMDASGAEQGGQLVSALMENTNWNSIDFVDKITYTLHDILNVQRIW